MRQCLASLVGLLAWLSTLAGASAPIGRSIRIDAVVGDAQGGVIRGLRASDFEILEDGAPRPVESAEFRWISHHSAAAVPPVNSREAEIRHAREAGSRVFAFFLDDLHISAGANADRVREAVGEFIDDKLFDRDLAAVIRPTDPIASVRFTRDRAELRGSLAAFAGRSARDSPGTPAGERLVGTALTDLAARLGELNADRAAVMIVSEGPVSARRDLDGLRRASSQFHFPIYTYNPAPVTGDADPGTLTLQWLARETGGIFVRAEAFIAGFARLFHDTHGYYALTYQPQHADGEFHQIEVRTRIKANVTARAGYWATPDGWSARESTAATEPSPRRVLRQSAAIETWLGVRRGRDGRSRMVLTWDARKGQPRQPHRVAVTARTLDGSTLFDGAIPAVGNGSPDRAEFDVATGQVEVDLVVLAADGSRIDTAAATIDVPDVGRSLAAAPGPLSVEILRARTLRELNALRADPEATPSATRSFGRIDRLLIRVPAGDRFEASAHVLNRAGQRMREIPASVTRDDVTQFEIPMSWLPPGPYLIEISRSRAGEPLTERIGIVVE